MLSSLIRYTALSVALIATQGTGGAQGLVPRAEPITPRSNYPASGGYQPGYQPNGGFQPAERSESVDPDNKLSPGDQVTVEIVEDREGGLPRVITATGDLDVPPLGRVKVIGKTTGEASADIKRKLEADYYYKATVKISIDRVSPTLVTAGSVYLYGDIRMVGMVSLLASDPLRLSEAIMKAGGFGPFGDDRKVKITRKSGEQIEVDVKQIITKGLRDKDPILQDGDRVFVPKLFFKG